MTFISLLKFRACWEKVREKSHINCIADKPRLENGTFDAVTTTLHLIPKNSHT